MGLLETGMYIGIVIGSVLCPYLFSKFGPKNIIIGATLLNAVSVSLFSFVENFIILFVSRVSVGIFLSVFIIYFPVWVDQCAPENSQALWISFYFLTEDLGIVVGYGIAFLFI